MKRIILFILLLSRIMPISAQESHNPNYEEKQYFLKYKKAAMNGDAVACTAVADCYRSGRGIGKDFDAAVMWYKKSIEGGFDVARVLLGSLYESINSVDKAYPLFLSCAELDESRMNDNIPILAMARNKVGEYLLYGKGVVKDEKQAVKWFESAAILNTPYNLAHSFLGYCYLRGQGVEIDSVKAFNFFKQSVQLTETEYAKCGLATCYLEGAGCSQNLGMVYSLLDENTIKLNGSKLILGVANYRDSTKDNHYNIATKYLLQLSEKQEIAPEIKGAALYWLQRCYRFGRGVTQNTQKAETLLKESSNLGYEPAMSLLDIVEQNCNYIKANYKK